MLESSQTTQAQNPVSHNPMTIEEKLKFRLESLAKNKAKNVSLRDEDSQKWIKENIALLGIPSKMLDTCVEILEYMGDIKAIWLHLQECTGCSESLLRTESPSFEVLVFDLFRFQYHDLIMTPSGYGANETLEQTIANERFVLLVEGSVPMGHQEGYITLGYGKDGYQELLHTAKKAESIFAVGTCSSYGGIQTAAPNPTNGHALSEILLDRQIVHIPGCPPSDKNIVANLVYYYLFEENPKLDSIGRPLWAYGKSVHDLCERRSAFMAGDFVNGFDDPNMANGYCLYKVGCKGPYTYNNCPKVKFNAKTSWPVQAGHGCIGCSEPNFWDNFGVIEKPLANKHFFTLNTKFFTKAKGAIKRIDAQTLESKAQDSTSALFRSLRFGIDVSGARIRLCDKKGEDIISSFSFECNPKVILSGLQNKSKQTKRLYENYLKAFPNRAKQIEALYDDKSQTSENLAEFFWLVLVLLDNELDSKILHKSPESIHIAYERFLDCACGFKFPYVSEFGFKLKKEEEILRFDASKAVPLIITYGIGGLDVYGVCYSVMCGIVESVFEAAKQYECPIVLENKALQNQIFSEKYAKNFSNDVYILG